MDALVRILREFPAIWALVGSIITVSGIGIFYQTLGKKLTPMYAKTVNDLAEVHQKQIDAHERALNMQKVHYDHEIVYLKSERDDYRTKLHAERDAHQITEHKLTEVEMRPNVDKVYKHQEAFFESMLKAMKDQGDTMRAIAQSIKDHDEGIEERSSKFVAQIVTAVKNGTL